MRSSVPRVRRSLLVLALASSALAVPDATHAEHSGSAGVYVREDSDHTTVISPRVRLRAPVVEDEVHVDLVYSVDVWTSASVDIVASASQPVTEQRDEINLGVDWVMGEATLGAGYRYSVEPDYESHGGAATFSLDLANKAATLAFKAGASFDRVGRVGDDDFSDHTDTLTTGASFTQVLGPSTVLQALYDLSLIRGYQASVYRFVGLGGDGDCRGTATFCRPEQNPRERMRHAAALRLRQALGDHFSLGAAYRFYFDDWGILSHTGKVDLMWAPDAQTALGLTYRLYLQGEADHYKRFYGDADVGVRYFTRDKELSPMSSHRAALELDRVWEIADGDAGLSTGLEIAPTFYIYDDYVLLDQVTAIEVTAVVGMEFP
jgi:hypothetical protein